MDFQSSSRRRLLDFEPAAIHTSIAQFHSVRVSVALTKNSKYNLDTKHNRSKRSELVNLAFKFMFATLLNNEICSLKN